MSSTTTELVESLEHDGDVISWINVTLCASENEDLPKKHSDLVDLEQHITHLLATLDIACEDVSSQLEHIIDDVSRSVPRLTYDLHFMKDGASSLQTSMTHVLERSRETVPEATNAVLDRLRMLDTVKNRMESAKGVLQEAESWSTLELEVTSLLSERSYAKAAERLSEASRSMVVFQNTPEYEPRRILLVNLQNHLEASLSSALVSAINTQDVALCRSYFSIFSQIQRESEFRNYYNASRRTSVVTMWHNAILLDCDDPSLDSSTETPSESFSDFLPRFYTSFVSLLNTERVSIAAIFPDPALTLSAFISSTLASLQPTFSQRLSSIVTTRGDLALNELISLLKSTEVFAGNVEKMMEKLKYITPPALGSVKTESSPANIRSHSRRRSTRMSISWRPGGSSAIANTTTKSLLVDGMEWDQELFQPFLDFQIDYSTLERRVLEHALHEIMKNDTKERVQDADRARLLRDRAVDISSTAEQSLSRCTAFTHGYGTVGLVQVLDAFFQSFIDRWTTDVRSNSLPTTLAPNPASDDDLSDMDYTAQDWSDFQLSLHLLSSARSVYEQIASFETKLRSNMIQTAVRFRLARDDPANVTIATCRGENQLLEQSPLNSAELHTMLNGVESEAHIPESLFSITGVPRHNYTSSHPGSSEPMLINARKAVFTFAHTCQLSLENTILSPLRKHLVSYASSPSWNAHGDPKSKRTTNDLQVPSFSLSPSEIVQRVAEGLLNLPRLFEVYADDDALAFSLQTLPHVDPEILRGLAEQPTVDEIQAQPTHLRRSSLVPKPSPIDAEAVSSAWLSSLGHSLLEHLTTTILPSIVTLSKAGAAQLASDLEYLANIVRALNVDFPDLDKWREYTEMDDEEGKNKLSEEDSSSHILQTVSRMRGWER